MEYRPEPRGVDVSGESAFPAERQGARAGALRSLLDDLTLGRLCLARAAEELPTNPGDDELREDLTDLGVALFGADRTGAARAADLVLGLGLRADTLPLLGQATSTPGFDRAALVRISTRHILRLRPADARAGRQDPHLAAWYAGSRGGGG
jgi:hypothetical protein